MPSFHWMDPACTLCRAPIAIDDINVATDIALCRRCGKTFSFSELIGRSAIAAPDLASPPDGAWFENTGDGIRVGATTHSWLVLFFLIPLTCAWSGMSLSSIYGTQISSGQFDLKSSLFGLPFLAGSIFLIGYCAMSLAGKVEVSQRGESLAVFTGVGWLGWTPRFSCSDFSSMREESRRNGWNPQNAIIVLEGRRRAAFGTMLTEERRYFVLSALRQMLWSSNRAGASGNWNHADQCRQGQN